MENCFEIIHNKGKSFISDLSIIKKIDYKVDKTWTGYDEFKLTLYCSSDDDDYEEFNYYFSDLEKMNFYYDELIEKIKEYIKQKESEN